MAKKVTVKKTVLLVQTGPNRPKAKVTVICMSKGLPMDIDVASLLRSPEGRQLLNLFRETLKRGAPDGGPSQPGKRIDLTGQGSGATTARQARSGRSVTETQRKKRKAKSDKTLKGRVKALEKTVGRELKQIYSLTRIVKKSSGTMRTVANGTKYFSFGCGDRTQNDSALEQIYQINDSAATAARLPLDMSDLSGSDGIPVRFARKMMFRNNTCFPVRACFYEVSVKVDNDQSPAAAITNGYQDRQLGGGEVNSYSWWPSDSKVFSQGYKIEQKEKLYMNPGDEFEMNVRTDWHKFNKEMITRLAIGQNSKILDSRYILVRIQGVVARHFNTTTSQFEIGTTDATLDYISEFNSEVKVPDEGNVTTLVNQDGFDTFSGPPEICGPNNVETPSA